MDDQVLELLNKRFDTLDARLETINDTIGRHVEKDETYWKKIDQQEGAISVWKWVAGLGGGGGALAAISQFFGKH